MMVILQKKFHRLAQMPRGHAKHIPNLRLPLYNFHVMLRNY